MTRLWSLRRSQWYSAERLRRQQERRLRAIVTHAYAQCSYYRRVFDAAGILPTDIGGLNDLTRLPILRRPDVQTHHGELVAANAHRFHPTPGSTSGTTGIRLEFVRDRDSLNVGNAALWRFRGWHGIGLRHRLAEVRGSEYFRLPSGALDFETVSRSAPNAWTLQLNLISPDPGRRAAVAEELVRFKPDAIRTGTPMLLAFLALYLVDHPEIQIRPKVVFAGGERIFPEMRPLFSQAFAAPFVEGYGNWEYVVFAGECERGRLHIASEVGIVEILREGQPCAPGEAGEIVVTNLWNRAFPFIRYAIGDEGFLEAEPCLCGRGLPTWRLLGGREKDMLVTPTGHLYLPNSIVATPRWRDKIIGIRFYQERRDAVAVQVVRGAGYTAEDERDLREELGQFFNGRLAFSIAYYDNLEQTPGGKHRYVVSTVSADTAIRGAGA